jgi:hypothetical protein
MDHRILSSADQHEQMLLLLPWYHNQSLDQDERQQVESHLHTCLICRREMKEVGKFAAAIKQSSVLDVAAEVSYARLQEKLKITKPVTQVPEPYQLKLDEKDKTASATSGFSWEASKQHRRSLRFNTLKLKRFAIAASVFLAFIPVMMQFGRQSSDTADYFTLSAAKPEVLGGTKLRVVFDKSLSMVGVESLLEKIHGKIIDGPNLVGGYTVRLDSDKDAAIALLRNQQIVLLVEPVLEE